jgi:hypothetical protein
MPVLGRSRPHGGARYVPAPLATRNPGALAQWGNALASLNFTPARWMAIGGGPTEGQGASTRTARWIETALSTIRTSKSAPSGQLYLSAGYGVTGPDSPWATTAVTLAGSYTVDTSSGVGYRIVNLSVGGTASGQFGTSAFGTAAFGGTAGGSVPGSVTFTVTGTSADLWYVSESTSGDFSYQVDSGSVVTVQTAGSHDLQRRTAIPLGANTSHTVKVTAVAGTSYVSGLTVYGTDTGTGIHLYDAARTSATSATFASNMVDITDAAMTVAPDLVTIELGLNDDSAALTPAQTGANIQVLINMLRALPKVPSIMLIIPPVPVPFTTSATATLSRTGWTVTADSQELSGEYAPVTNVLDGDVNTFWHTKWAGTADPLPHQVTIDMHVTQQVAGIRYLPRPGGGNGTIGQYRVDTSLDGTTWTTGVSAGTWADSTAEKTATWTAANARYVRLNGITEAGNRGPWSSAAEINLLGTTSVQVSGINWPDYISVLRRMAAVDTNLALLDLSLAMAPAAIAGTALYRTDNRNWNDTGHSTAATQFTNFANLAVTVIPGGGGGGSGRYLLFAGVA